MSEPTPPNRRQRRAQQRAAAATQTPAPRPGASGIDWGHPWAPVEEPPATAKTIAVALGVVLCAVAAAVVIVVNLAP